MATELSQHLRDYKQQALLTALCAAVAGFRTFQNRDQVLSLQRPLIALCDEINRREASVLEILEAVAPLDRRPQNMPELIAAMTSPSWRRLIELFSRVLEYVLPPWDGTVIAVRCGCDIADQDHDWRIAAGLSAGPPPPTPDREDEPSVSARNRGRAFFVPGGRA